MTLSWATTIILALTLSCLFILTTWKWRNKGAKLPPGPLPLPFLGNLLQLRITAMLDSCLQLRETYGPVFTVYFGSLPVVVLCGHDAVKEALVGQADDFSGRGRMGSVPKNREEGLTFANGEQWKILRRFTLTALRDFGMGKRRIEERILEEAGFLLKEFHKTKGAPINPTFFLSCAVCNVISSIVFGSRFDYEDRQFRKLLQMIQWNLSAINSPLAQLYNMYPGVMQYLSRRNDHNLKKELTDFITTTVKAHEASLVPQNPRDFIDCFLIKMHQDQHNPHTEFNLQTLFIVLFNLFSASTETITSRLYIGFLLLLKHPEVMAKVHEEIDQVIGPHRLPSMDDRLKMPYTDAVIHEILRRKRAGMGFPRCVTRDTEFRGYLLPKGTIVYPLLDSVHNDPSYFSQPNAFYPQHFLDEQGQFKKNEAFMPFSCGKRVCPGEALARQELFLYFTSILQSFSLRPLVPPRDIDITPRFVNTVSVYRQYEFCFLPR
ncbi:cytochrome P450 2G1-like [Erinaceus europaeus]|uniref:Cytochrome P450 2G1-like n=1 Tax=Erinaceus europaeus TaxID=9365 RepID=A0ABM3WZF8_ERIEU|nr:cytochrome P450 2G1-like [Erinaceus europaeus]XP_060041945.1 cytochrome P450 2G1-like [Erinaceus europaeus]XP_060041947.1 cytochrome P450 2G1-like [Erinaceus europaeus]